MQATEIDEALAPELPTALLEHGDRFLKFLERRLPSRELALEVLQGAYLRALEKSATIRDEESAVAWFYRLLRNALTDHYRRRGREERALDALVRQEVTAEDDAMIQDVACRCVLDLLPALKPEYAEIVERVDLGGVPVPQAAAELGITANNAGVRLHRARAALRRQLERCCGACSDHHCRDCTCHRR